MSVTSLGGIELPYPDMPLTKAEIQNTVQRRSADNTLLTTVSGSVKYRWQLKWSYVSPAEMAIIKARALVATAQTWQPPDEAVSYTCVVKRNTLSIRPEPDENNYIIEFELEEV